MDGERVYEPSDAADATARWLHLVAERGGQVLLIDTVDKAAGKHLIRTRSDDADGVFFRLAEMREFGRRSVFGLYVTTEASDQEALTPTQQRDIGLQTAKRPSREKIARVKLLLEGGSY